MKCNILALWAVTAIFASCSKDYNPGNVVAPASGNYTLVSAMSELAVMPKTVTIDAATGGTFKGNSGTQYIFASNAFRTATGATVTGMVTVQVSEYLKKSDMLFSGVLPISGGEPLLSGGEINVTASQGGLELKLNPNVPFTANMPMRGTDAAGMRLFTGKRDQATGQVNWMPVADSAVGIATIGTDTISIISNTLDYCNADRFMSNPDYQTFTVKAVVSGGQVVNDSLMGYTLYDTYNGVWPLYLSSGGVFHETHVPTIPVHFVVIGVINGIFYGGITAATPANGGSYQVILTQITPSAFKTQVDAL